MSIVKWGIDKAHSEVGFKVKHLMVSTVRGAFRNYDADIVTTGEDFLTAEVDFWIESDSVDTGAGDRDKHIRSADFFDTEHYKQIHFIGKSYQDIDHDGSYAVHGDLTIKGISRRIQLDVEFGGIIKDPWGNQKAVLQVNGKINRKDWGLNWNLPLETGGLLVSEEVQIHVVLQLFRRD
jgi:polyisoprenoid-binding protein YceI